MRKNNDDLVLTQNPKSKFSESIKTIRTNLQFSSIDKNVQIILNTSPESGDGKSFFSANLAIAYALQSKKVLIIDCDLRKGKQHRIFCVENDNTKGYANLILDYKDNVLISDYIVKTNVKNVSLLPTGLNPSNPVELLASKVNRLLMQKLRSMYDIIILDCPPVLGISDATVLTDFSDANILVISNKKTKIELVERAKKVFEQANSKITGVVINKVKLKDKNYFSYYSDEYYGD